MTASLKIEKAFIERSVNMDCFDVHLLAARDSTATQVYHPIAHPVLHHVPNGDYYERKPAFNLDRPSAQALLDGLWEVGVRPSSGDQGNTIDSKATISAMQAHINDLRMVANLSTKADRPATAANTF